MKRIFYTSAVLGAGTLGLIGCSSPATNSGNKAVSNTNANTAVVMNTNANMAMNSTANSTASSNTSSSTSANMTTNLSGSDKEFMIKAAQGGIEEVELGKMAVAKGQSEEVKTFGQKMTFDHTKANDALKAIAAKKGVSLPTEVSSKQKEDMDKLSKLSGAAFDKEYIRMMIEDHEKDVAEFQKQADSSTEIETKMFAVETLPTLKMHLGMIKNMSTRVK